MRCYDVHQMSMKFERGLDSDVVKFQFLSEDYTKVSVITACPAGLVKLTKMYTDLSDILFISGHLSLILGHLNSLTYVML